MPYAAAIKQCYLFTAFNPRQSNKQNFLENKFTKPALEIFSQLFLVFFFVIPSLAPSI